MPCLLHESDNSLIDSYSTASTPFLYSIATVSLFVLGLFTLAIPSSFAQPCENNGHAVLGTGKQLLKQSNRCIIIENNNPSSGICGPNSLQNGICVPITPPPGITCPIGSILQNGICVPFTNPVLSAPVAVPTVSPSSTVVGNTFVTLNGLGSYATTSGATIESYSWVQTSGPTVSLTGANTATPTFQAPIVINQISLVFSLIVTDSLGQVSAPVSVTVTVTPS